MKAWVRLGVLHIWQSYSQLALSILHLLYIHIQGRLLAVIKVSGLSGGIFN